MYAHGYQRDYFHLNVLLFQDFPVYVRVAQ